ncbi:hypothetical protein SDRG_10184 [Saprolegnia diclina VS20]|uniref:MARVEL domain-containing protein n=1 Tax=Saprolegnia diclina (strain VS20) TaxID=1156394 RepID=T0Q2E4_SAPDV|nr:hypothetical protein SDRG_10184 [Saprolegnia diclina VS20]EQC31984.1 hypothetical protein SDRG_10184 [Saprolegnia diclina VS20]|eukprot:XP_008614386.1 hypothetical protein SDRG_10184 [Saprolegnia diclina VS20]
MPDPDSAGYEEMQSAATAQCRRRLPDLVHPLPGARVPTGPNSGIRLSSLLIFAMTTTTHYLTLSLRSVEMLVALLAVVVLCHVFHPVKPPVRKLLVLPGSYTVGTMLVASIAAFVLSASSVVLHVSKRWSTLRIGAQAKMAVAFAVAFLVGTIMLADSSHYRYCHRSANVSCEALEWSMTTLFVLSMLCGVDAVLQYDQVHAAPEDMPLTPNAKPSATMRMEAATPV